MIDAPGPWGSGPFTLAEGYSSLENEIAIIGAQPLNCVWLDTAQPRTDRLVLEANTDHWNIERGPRLEKVVFRNDVPHDRALELVCDTEGEIDIVTEVGPSDAQRVEESEHARLEAVDAMRIVTGVINRSADDVPLDDARMRKALNMAVDRDRMVGEIFAGYAHPLSGLTHPTPAGSRKPSPTRTTPTKPGALLARPDGPRVGVCSLLQRPTSRPSPTPWPKTFATL